MELTMRTEMVWERTVQWSEPQGSFEVCVSWQWLRRCYVIVLIVFTQVQPCSKAQELGQRGPCRELLRLTLSRQSQHIRLKHLPDNSAGQLRWRCRMFSSTQMLIWVTCSTETYPGRRT